MTITNDDLTLLRRRGFDHLIPLDENKQPIGSWKFNKMGDPDSGYRKFSNEELLKAAAVGCNLEADRITAVDLDSPEARCFDNLYDETFTTFSKGKGVSQLLYKLADDVEPNHYSLPKKGSAALAEDGTIIENIAKTQSFLFGLNKTIHKDIPLKVLDKDAYAKLHKLNKKVYALSMLKRLYPKKDSFRDDFRLTLAGTLHLETDWSDNEKKHFVKTLCNAAGDKAVNKAIEKLGRVKKNMERNLKNGKEITDGIWTTNNLAKLCNRPGIEGGLDFIDSIRSEKRQQQLEKEETATFLEEEEKIDPNGILEFCNLTEFLTTEFPRPSYIIEPFVTDQSITQIVGSSGVGKTMFGLEIAGAIANASGLLDMPSVGGPRPILYIEGELPGADVQDRINGMIDKIKRKCDPDMFWTATMQQQLKKNPGGFVPINTPQGLINIENTLLAIKARTGQMPVVFIDNISCLANGMKENEADEWSPIINKFVKWKNMGSTIFYFHHLNKSGASSGSTMQDRTIDMVIRMSKPDHKQKIKTFDEQGVQAIVDFPKWRLHDNSKYAEPHMLICENWNWQKLPILSSEEMEIIRMHNDNSTLQDISEELGKNYKTISRKRKKLLDKGIIKPNEHTAKEDKDVEDDDSEKENQKKFKKMFPEHKEGASIKHPNIPGVVMSLNNIGNKRNPNFKIVYSLEVRPATAYASLNQLLRDGGIAK